MNDLLAVFVFMLIPVVLLMRHDDEIKKREYDV